MIHKCPEQILIVSILIHRWCGRRAFCHSGRFWTRAHNRFWRSTTLFWLRFRSRFFLGSAAFFSLRLNFWFIFYNFRLNFCNFWFIFYNFWFISTSVSVGSGGSGGCSCRSSSLSGTVFQVLPFLLLKKDFILAQGTREFRQIMFPHANLLGYCHSPSHRNQ